MFKDFDSRDGPPLRGAGALDHFMAGPTGAALARPTFDRAALWAITRWYLPLGRAAAIAAAGNEPAQFCRDLGLEDIGESRVTPLLARVERHRQRYEESTARWEAAFFAGMPHPTERLVSLEADRARAARAFFAQWKAFAGLHVRKPLGPVNWHIPGPEEVRARYGTLLGQPERAFGSTGFWPIIEESARIPARFGEISWVRFTSPAAEPGDTAWARVYSPRNVVRPPTVLLIHGIGVETEFSRLVYDPFDRLVQAGICLVRLEAPWHGRRRLPGYAGGAPVVARAPLGMLEFLDGALGELAVLATWARERNGGPVAFAGVSLGALAAQRAAVSAHHWTPEAQPDALLLVGTTGSIAAVVYRGSLMKAVGLPAALTAGGWTRALLHPWRRLIEPRGEPALSSENIVIVLGTEDDVTPFPQALPLVGRWAIPEENLFLRRQGHFSLVSGLFRDVGPLQRLVAILRKPYLARDLRAAPPLEKMAG